MRSPGLYWAAVLLVSANVIGLVSAQTVARNPRSSPEEEQLGIVIPMRDGVRLAADVFLPGDRGKWPTILVRTPYNRKSPTNASYRYFTTRGYAVVVQDVRGRHASQGAFGSIAQEGPDGDDTIDWI